MSETDLQRAAERLKLDQCTAGAPLRIESVANLREHWAKKAARTAAHRAMGKLLAHQASLWLRWKLSMAGERVWRCPVVPRMRVTITRIAPRSLDSDNVQSAFKAFRDGIADHFGVDDRADWYEWRYEQRKGKPREYAVEVLVEPQEAVDAYREAGRG